MRLEEFKDKKGGPLNLWWREVTTSHIDREERGEAINLANALNIVVGIPLNETIEDHFRPDLQNKYKLMHCLKFAHFIKSEVFKKGKKWIWQTDYTLYKDPKGNYRVVGDTWAHSFIFYLSDIMEMIKKGDL